MNKTQAQLLASLIQDILKEGKATEEALTYFLENFNFYAGPEDS